MGNRTDLAAAIAGVVEEMTDHFHRTRTTSDWCVRPDVASGWITQLRAALEQPQPAPEPKGGELCPLCTKTPYSWGREGWVDCETDGCALRGVQMPRKAWNHLPRRSDAVAEVEEIKRQRDRYRDLRLASMGEHTRYKVLVGYVRTIADGAKVDDVRKWAVKALQHSRDVVADYGKMAPFVRFNGMNGSGCRGLTFADGDEGMVLNGPDWWGQWALDIINKSFYRFAMIAGPDALADKLAGSAPAEPLVCDRCNKEITYHYQTVCSACVGKESALAEPSPDAARLADEMEQWAENCSSLHDYTSGEIHERVITWAAEVRRLQPGQAKAPARVWVVYHDDIPYVFAHNSVAGEFAYDCHSTPFGTDVIGAAECERCAAGWIADRRDAYDTLEETRRAAEQAAQKLIAQRDAALAELARCDSDGYCRHDRPTLPAWTQACRALDKHRDHEWRGLVEFLTSTAEVFEQSARDNDLPDKKRKAETIRWLIDCVERKNHTWKAGVIARLERNMERDRVVNYLLWLAQNDDSIEGPPVTLTMAAVQVAAKAHLSWPAGASYRVISLNGKDVGVVMDDAAGRMTAGAVFVLHNDEMRMVDARSTLVETTD